MLFISTGCFYHSVKTEKVQIKSLLPNHHIIKQSVLKLNHCCSQVEMNDNTQNCHIEILCLVNLVVLSTHIYVHIMFMKLPHECVKEKE